MRIDIVTLFPELCDGFLSTSILGRARAKNLFEAHCHQIRDYTKNKQRQTDDYPYGGGCGMVLYAQPIADCLRAVADQCAQQGRSRCGHLLLHVGQIHGRHLLLEHVFKNLGQAQAPGQKAAYVHMGEARGQGAVFLGNGSHSLLQCRHTVQVARRVQRDLSQARPPLGRQIREGQNARQGPHMAGSRIKPRQVAPGPVVGHHHQGLARHIAAEPVQVGLEVRQKGTLPGKNQKGRAAHAKASSGGNRPSQCSCKGETTVSVTRRKRRRSR